MPEKSYCFNDLTLIKEVILFDNYNFTNYLYQH